MSKKKSKHWTKAPTLAEAIKRAEVQGAFKVAARLRKERDEIQARRKARQQRADQWKQVQPPIDIAAPKGRWLYRMYDAADRLLYIGITDRGHVREREHKHSKPWFTEVHNITYERIAKRANLQDLERLAIRTEKPKYNIQHNR